MNGDGRLDLVTTNQADGSTTLLVQAPPIVAPTVTFRGAPASAVYGSTFVVTATTNASIMPAIAASGGACRIGPVAGTPEAATATVTMTSGTGSCVLDARWPETDDYAAAGATQTTTARQAATLTLATPGLPSPSTPGQPVFVGFAVLGLGVPTGSVTVTASTGESCTGTLNNLLGSCTITFTTAGTRTLRATYSGNANFQSSVSPALLHTVIAPTLSLTPTTYDYGVVRIGSTKAKVFKLVNDGSVAARISNIAIGSPGSHPSAYRVTTTCGATVEARSSCDITVTFAATSAGVRTATLIVSDNAVGSPHTAALTATAR